MSRPRVLVTGARGFIGAHLTDALQQRGYEVWGYSRTGPASARGVRYVTGDIVELSAVPGGWPPRFDAIFHLAGIAGVREALEDFARALAVNGVGTARVCELARHVGAPPVILASSVYVYDGCETLPWHEDLPVRPRSPLGASKVAAEAIARAFSECHDLRVTALRLFTVYGPRSRPSQFLPDAIRKILQAERAVAFGRPEASRDFVYVEDVVEACLKAWAFGARTPGFHVFNIGSGVERRVEETVQQLLRLCGRQALQVKYAALRDRADERGVATRHCGVIDQARAQLGWEPQVPFEEGLRRMVAWYAPARPAAAGAGARAP